MGTFPSPRSPNPACRFPAPGSPVESCGSHTNSRSERAIRCREPWHQARTLALACRCVVRPVDAVTTATAQVVVFAWACDDVRYCCSYLGVIGLFSHSREPAPLRHPFHLRSLPSAGITRLDPRYLRTSPPPFPAPPCPHGSSVGACHAAGRVSRVASVSLLHACRRQYPGGTDQCSRRSLPDRCQPSPY